MKIWVDADACPTSVREILCKAAVRTSTELIFVANQFIPTPKSSYISMLQVSTGFDVADDEIVRRCDDGDLVITSDIPLAAEVLAKGARVLAARGDRYTQDNIKAKLNMRDFMDTMRASGVQSGGQKPMGQTEKQKFANQLDRILASR